MLKKWSRKRLHFASASGKLGLYITFPGISTAHCPSIQVVQDNQNLIVQNNPGSCFKASMSRNRLRQRAFRCKKRSAAQSPVLTIERHSPLFKHIYRSFIQFLLVLFSLFAAFPSLAAVSAVSAAPVSPLRTISPVSSFRPG